MPIEIKYKNNNETHVFKKFNDITNYNDVDSLTVCKINT